MLTATDIETFVREHGHFKDGYEFICGEKFFDMVAQYVNSGKMTLETLKRCMKHDDRIFDNKPSTRIGYALSIVTPRSRMVMLKKSQLVVTSEKKKDLILLLEDRIRRLERKVERIQEDLL